MLPSATPRCSTIHITYISLPAPEISGRVVAGLLLRPSPNPALAAATAAGKKALALCEEAGTGISVDQKTLSGCRSR